MLARTLFIALLIATSMLASIEAHAQEETSITGTLLGQDGRPMPKAHVHLIGVDALPLLSVEANEDGSFAFLVEKTGLFFLQFTGVDHKRHKTALYLEHPQPVKVEVKLGTLDYVRDEDFQYVRVVGGLASKPFERKEYMLEPQPNGTFSLEIESTAGPFAFYFTRAAQHVLGINGSQSDDYIYDREVYHSVVTPKQGKVEVVFDPSKLIRSEKPGRAIVQFEQEDGLPAQVARIHAQILEHAVVRGTALGLSIRQQNHPALVDDFKATHADLLQYDWQAEQAKLSAQIATEQHPILRRALLVSYLDADGEDLDLVQQAFMELSPDDVMWSLKPGSLNTALKATGQPAHYEDYIARVIARHPDPAVKAPFLFKKLRAAYTAGRMDEAQDHYEVLIREAGKTKYGYMAKERYAPDRRIMEGKRVPAFEVSSLDDSSSLHADKNLIGRVYLIDFWATWCGPCIAEMDNLHRAFERYKDEGFTILSISVDTSPEDVAVFRAERWPMPWLNALLAEGFESEMAQAFELDGVPKSVLVNEHGEIVATDIDLRGEALAKTVGRVFAH